MEMALCMMNRHGTQNRPQRDPYGCDASHDLMMFRPAGGGRTPFVAPAPAPGWFDPARGHVYRLRMPTQKEPKAAAPDFELAMRDLEELVERLEQGDLPLEESLAAFERGVMLTRACQTALKEAEQKVEILLKKAGEPAIEEFSPEESKAG
jgi:exodeoxyribonuclease VII small subunit